MFKKLLSNLPFNPSLIGQVSFYAKRINKEERLRRLGLILVVLSLFVQTFAAINKPQSTLAVSQNDIITGGFSTQAQAVNHCNANNYEFRTILNHFGIDCERIASSSVRSIRSTDYDRKLLSIGRMPYGKTGERSVGINGKTYYQRYLWAWDTGAYSTYTALHGTRADGTPFMVLFNCGNVTVVETPPAPAPPPPAPTPPAAEPTPPPDVCPKLAGTQSDRSECPDDVCPYKEGTQTSPEDCDVCPYKEGVQARLSECDVCPYRLGIQATEAECDVCPYVAGTQETRSECDVCPGIPGTQSDQAECKPCEAAQTDEDTTACLVLNKSARNNTQRIDSAEGTIAHAGDSITYTLTTKNTGKASVKGFVVEENIADILDYATVTNLNGGKIGDDNIVRWGPTDLSPGETVTRRITVHIKNPVPETPISASNPGTFDLTMTNVYGNAVNIKLPPSVTKTTEQVVRRLPNTGPGTSVAAASAFMVFVGYFFARSRLYAKELSIVRTEFVTTGGY